MTISRTIRWVLLFAAVGLLGYFGWQQYHRVDQASATNNAQKSARNAIRVTIAPGQKTDCPAHYTGLITSHGFITVSRPTRAPRQLHPPAFHKAHTPTPCPPPSTP